MPTIMNNTRTHSAVQASVANPSWGDDESDRLGYDVAAPGNRMITKRYLAGGIDGETGAYNDPISVVGFTTSFDKASNKLYERHLHAESRSHLYQPRDQDGGGVIALGYDSIDRLRQYQRGVLNDGTGGGEGTVPGCQIAPSGGITLPNARTQQTYALDGLGNWKNTTFTPVGDAQIIERRDHNHLNQITATKEDSDPKVLFSYDGTTGASNGNLANDGTRLYKYDAFNRLLEVYKDPNGTPVLIGSYVYDALNRRVRKFVVNGGLSGSIPNGLTHYLFAPGSWRVIEEINSQIQTLKQYVWGIYLDELIQQKQVAALNNFSAGDELYPLQDLLYRTTGLADDAGVVREAYDCDAYGNTLIFRNSGSPPSAIAFDDADTQVVYPTCEIIFTGQRWNAEARIYYLKLRYMIPDLGLFATRDPILYNSAMNLHACMFAQFMCLDPFGLDYHHWFMQYQGVGETRKGQTLVNEKCKKPHIDIDRYTTWLDNSRRGTPHHWVHNDFDYQRKYEIALSTSVNCCDFLLRVYALIIATNDALAQQDNHRGGFPNSNQHFSGHVSLRNRYSPLADTHAELLSKIMEACCVEKKEDLDWQFIRRQVRAYALNESVPLVRDSFAKLPDVDYDKWGDASLDVSFAALAIAMALSGVGAPPRPVPIPTRPPVRLPQRVPQLTH